MPAPSAGPLTAATVGSSLSRTATYPAYVSLSGAFGSRRSSTDPPAENTLPCRSKHDCPDAVVRRHAVHGLRQCPAHAERQGVSVFRVVEGDDGNATSAINPHVARAFLRDLRPSGTTILIIYTFVSNDRDVDQVG